MMSSLVRFSLITLVLSSQSPAQPRYTQRELDARIKQSVDSALRLERASSLRFDASVFKNGEIEQPLLLFPDSYKSHIALQGLGKDGAWWSSWEDQSPSFYKPYSVSFVSADRTVPKGIYTGFSPMLYFRGPEVSGVSAPAVRFAAAGAPSPDSFPGPPLTILKQQPREHLATYVEDRYFRMGWPSKPSSRSISDSTVNEMVTDYLLEPLPFGRRQRHVAFMVRLVASARSRCTRVSIFWRTRSKGLAETDWSVQPEDVAHTPSQRPEVVRWFDNFKNCSS